MNEDQLDQILKELKKISQILEQKNEQEKLKKDLDGLDFKTNAEACNKVGGMQQISKGDCMLKRDALKKSFRFVKKS